MFGPFGRTLLVITALLEVASLTSCTGVDIQQLTPSGDRAKGAPGLIYYQPAPYLLVAELPPTANSTSGGTGQATAPARQNPPDAALPAPAAPAAPPTPGTPPGAGSPSTGGGGQTGGSGNDASANGTSAPSSGSDTSFGGATPQYIIKLIYLPDRTRPMAMTERVGFGTVDMKPLLQDGWMLTSLDANADSKTAENLTALSSLISAAGGLASPAGAAKAATSSKPGGGPKGTGTKIPADLSGYFAAGHFILRPGLYRFVYDDETGVLVKLEPVSIFTGCGTVLPSKLVGLACP